MRKTSLPAVMLVLTVVAIIVFLATSMPMDGDRQSRPQAQTEQQSAVPSDCNKNMCYEVRSDGPRIITRGDITLHIPITADTRSVTPPMEIDFTGVAVCFPGPGDPPPCKGGVPAYRFWLREGSYEFVTKEQADETLSRITERLEGPIQGPADGVLAYTSKTGTVFVLPEKDATGRFVIANCWTQCTVRNHVYPGLFADYRFPPAFIGQWPELDQAIRHYFESVRAAEE
jgi:hypothetical protein